MSSLSSDTVVHVCKLAATVNGVIIAMIAASERTSRQLTSYTHKPPLLICNHLQQSYLMERLRNSTGYSFTQLILEKCVPLRMRSPPLPSLYHIHCRSKWMWPMWRKGGRKEGMKVERRGREGSHVWSSVEKEKREREGTKTKEEVNLR